MMRHNPAGTFAPTPTGYFSAFVEGRRGEILDAGLAVFGDKGYEAGTMREIAARVGVSEPALYRHYESKEAILADIVATAGDRISSGMRAGLSTLSAENVGSMLHALIEMRRGAVTSDTGGVLHVLFHAAPHNSNFIGLLRAHLGQPMIDAVREAIPRVDAGFGIERSAAQVDAQVRVFMSLFAGYFTTNLIFDGPVYDDAVVEALLAIMGWETRSADPPQAS
jgi:AcrR family transcriptional regulator